MGALRAGDEVFGSDGMPTRVEYVSPVHIGLRCWRLTFSDGSSIVADEQHRWLTRHSFRPWVGARRNGSGNGGRWRDEVVTTPQIAGSIYRARRDSGKEHNHKIRVAPALESADVPLSIDPYVLGAWLGDGTSASGSFTCGEADLSEMSAMLAVGLGGAVRVARYGSRAPTIRTPGLGFQGSLRTLCVLGNKHIPDVYFSAGTAQRWALLQGLMDTDGTVSRHAGKTTARASFSGINEALCRGVWRLARSLGLKATFREGDAKLAGCVVGKAYSVAFPAVRSQPVFRLARKQSLLPQKLGVRSGTVTIVACEEVASVPTVCIKVSAADSLFLAGHGCIPTHNTALAAFLLLLHLCGPRARPNSQLYSAAQSRDQAGVLFSLAAKMVRMSPELSAHVTVVDSGKRLHCPELGTVYRALSADATTAYGLSPAFIVHDELGQVKGPKSELYEALETATAAQESPLSIIISTQAPTDGDLMSVLIDDAMAGNDPRTVVSLYTADPELDPFSEEAIRQANPAFGDFQNADEVLAMAEDARRMRSREPEYRNLVLNQRVEMRSPFISKSLWLSCVGKVLKDFGSRPVYGGLDLSEVSDLTSLELIADVDGIWHVRSKFWLPAEGLRERSKHDRVPYDRWKEEGFLTAVPGNSVEYSYVAAEVARLFDYMNIQKIAFDRWNWRHFRPWLERAGMTAERIDAHFLEFGQGFQSMSPALRDLESAILSGRLCHDSHPVLNMCAANAIVKTNEAGGRKLDKMKSHGRIDGLVSLAMAIGAAPDVIVPARVPEYQTMFVG